MAHVPGDSKLEHTRDLTQAMNNLVAKHFADGKVNIDVVVTACFTVMIAYLQQMPRGERVRKYTNTCAAMLRLVTGE